MSDLTRTTHAHLVEMRKLIDTPEKWTKKCYARTALGAPTSYEDTQATCFCILGALNRVTAGKPLPGEVAEIKRHLPYCFEFITLDQFNDCPTTTHADILALLDRAIEGTK